MIDSILGETSFEVFIEDHWQKEPLLVREALPDIGSVIESDDLAGLACEPGVESRIVIRDKAGGTWSCEDGPFEESRFDSLPDKNWTLLVQSVDQWIPSVAGILDYFDFLPRWRLDDVMISYAADGGCVGPHFDYYDVFLLQASGSRGWQLGQRCDGQSPLRDHTDMKLLRDFRPAAEYLLKPGDMLYVPSGLAHWGRAIGGDGMTISIGFRAPSYRDIIRGAVEHVTGELPEEDLYRDIPGAFDEDRWCINQVAIDSLLPRWDRLETSTMKAELARSFGRLLTEPRNPDLIFSPGDYSEESMLQLVARGSIPIKHHPASRFAYRILEEDADGPCADLYVDGQAHVTTLALARGICHREVDQHALAEPAERDLLVQLFSQGSLFLPLPDDQWDDQREPGQC